MGRIIPWTEAEFETLRKIYPEHGLKVATEALPGRSEAAVQFKAWQLRLFREGPRARRRSSRPAQPAAKLGPVAPSRPKPAPAAPAAPALPAPPSAPKRNCEVVKAADIRPGMIVNRYPVGTSAAPALREVTEARFSDSGSRVFFNLAWRPAADAKGKREMPAAFWDFYRNPELAFEVYPSLDAIARQVRP